MKDHNPLRFPLLILIIIFIVVITVGLLINNKDFSDYFINISVEVLGAIITLLVIDFYIGRQEQKVADKREKIAWTILKPIMQRHFSTLFNIFKATTETKGDNYATKELQRLFSENYIDTI